MKFVTHQTTLHLSFKIKWCVDRLRPPLELGHGSTQSACRKRANRRHVGNEIAEQTSGNSDQSERNASNRLKPAPSMRGRVLVSRKPARSNRDWILSRHH